MKRWLGIVALLLAAGGVVVMLLPTFDVRWGVDPALGLDPPVTRHSWFDPLLPGYARFDAPLALVAGIAGVLLLLVSLRRPRPSWVAIGCLIAGAVVPLLGYAVHGTLGRIAVLAPILLAASAVTAISWRQSGGRRSASRVTAHFDFESWGDCRRPRKTDQ